MTAVRNPQSLTESAASRLAALALLLTASVVQAAPAEALLREEAVDLNKDGRKETRMFYENGLPVRSESDENNDGKTDVFTTFRAGKKFSSEADRNHDGRIDQWKLYNPKGSASKVCDDTNKDGKPDQWKQLLRGTMMILKENDRNFDGRVDRRVLQEFDANRRLFVGGNPPKRLLVPGYVTIWREEDTDYDGDVDVFKQKGDPNPDKSRIGRAMGGNLFEVAEAAPPEPPSDPLWPESRISQLNEKHGLGGTDKGKKND